MSASPTTVAEMNGGKVNLPGLVQKLNSTQSSERLLTVDDQVFSIHYKGNKTVSKHLHVNRDALEYCLQGKLIFKIYLPSGVKTITLEAGEMTVIPKDTYYETEAQNAIHILVRNKQFQSKFPDGKIFNDVSQ
jgi:hypothetical protein